jgi:hypothetical protein
MHYTSRHSAFEPLRVKIGWTIRPVNKENQLSKCPKGVGLYISRIAYVHRPPGGRIVTKLGTFGDVAEVINRVSFKSIGEWI